VAVANELAAHWAFESFVPREEAGVVDTPHKFHYVCELSRCDFIYHGRHQKKLVSTVVNKIFSISFGYGEEFAMLFGVVKGSYGGGETVLSCICFEVGVC
jgi:hypothetical protein